MQRRNFLTTAAAAAVVPLIPLPAVANALSPAAPVLTAGAQGLLAFMLRNRGKLLKGGITNMPMFVPISLGPNHWDHAAEELTSHGYMNLKGEAFVLTEKALAA